MKRVIKEPNPRGGRFKEGDLMNFNEPGNNNTTDRSLRRTLVQHNNIEQMKKYNVIYADPPWSYDNKKTGGSLESGADDKYSTMGLDEIKNMPIDKLTEGNALLFMWVVVPLLPEGLEVLKSWGFRYKTMLTWDKGKFGTGFWFRGQTEHLLLGVKGKVKPFRSSVRNLFYCLSGEHSQKPQYVRDMISEVVKISFDNPEKLELFARSREGFFPDYEYEGWDVYGNQVNKSIVI